MKSDAVVIGAELEALVAAMRCAERGIHVRLLMPGAGSLPYAFGGLSILGHAAGPQARDPFAGIAALADRHPLRIVGADRARRHVAWFLDHLRAEGSAWHANGVNASAVTMTGQVVPVFAYPDALAILERLGGGAIAVVTFDRFRDFPGRLCVAGLRRRGLDVCVVAADGQGLVGDAARLAHVFDDMETGRRVLTDLRPRIPAGTRAIVFPACLGLERHRDVVQAAEEALGARVFEVPTLPPSVPGLRLHRFLMHGLRARGVDVHPGVRGLTAECRQGRCRALIDRDGHRYEAAAYLAGTGGVMTGGLDVDSRGVVREPIFGSAVHQTAPLRQAGAPAVADALHRAGVEADEAFRPRVDGATIGNVFASGAILAHANPVEEGCGDGVAIATACAAADGALAHIGAG